jgi:hypothetical protein
MAQHVLRYSCVVGTSSGRTTAADKRSGAGVRWERRKNSVKGCGRPVEGGEVRAQEGEEEVRWEGEERGRRSTRSAEAGLTGQRSPTLTSSTLGIEDLGLRTKDSLRQAGEERAMAGRRMGELELLSVSS